MLASKSQFPCRPFVPRAALSTDPLNFARQFGSYDGFSVYVQLRAFERELWANCFNNGIFLEVKGKYSRVVHPHIAIYQSHYYPCIFLMFTLTLPDASDRILLTSHIIQPSDSSQHQRFHGFPSVNWRAGAFTGSERGVCVLEVVIFAKEDAEAVVTRYPAGFISSRFPVSSFCLRPHLAPALHVQYNSTPLLTRRIIIILTMLPTSG